MTGTELAVIIGCGVLGYWLVAVMWPSLRTARASSPPPVPEQPRVMWHEELGIAPDAARETIEAAFRAKVAEYHPDRIAHLPIEAREQARMRVLELELAYDAALRDLEWLRPRGREL